VVGAFRASSLSTRQPANRLEMIKHPCTNTVASVAGHKRVYISCMLYVKEQVVGSYILHGADVACAHAHDALIRFVDKVYMTAICVYTCAMSLQ
jgi:hypothetical protein